jgi:hypothetical protein
VGDENCINWRLYATANDYKIDTTRRFLPEVDPEGKAPFWPEPAY